MEVTEEQIRQWVRDEHDKILAEKQANCSHAEAGYFGLDGDIYCERCDKHIDDEDGCYQSTGAEFKYKGEVL